VGGAIENAAELFTIGCRQGRPSMPADGLTKNQQGRGLAGQGRSAVSRTTASDWNSGQRVIEELQQGRVAGSPPFGGRPRARQITGAGEQHKNTHPPGAIQAPTG